MFAHALIWLMNVGEAVFFLYIVVWIVILLPLAFFRRTRPLSLLGTLIGTWTTGGILWVTSVGILYLNSGWKALLLGLVLGGIGVVPAAWLFALTHWMTTALGDLAFLTVGAALPLLVIGVWVSRTER